MRVKAFLLGSLFTLGGLLSAQEIIKNPDKPANPNAGRILNLREELRITDAGGEFFLQYPSIPKTGPDGSIYVRDRDELLQFDAKGRFRHNFFKKGQGPGELNDVSNFDPAGDLLLVHSNDPGKLVWFDEKGKAVREVSLAAAGGRMDLVFHAADHSYFFKHGFPSERGKATPVDLPYSLLVISDGEDNNSRYTEDEVLRALRETDATLYSIGTGVRRPSFSPDEQVQAGDDLLTELAESTGGRYFAADRPRDLPDVVSRIDVRHEYVLGYSPTPLRHDGKYHEVELRLAGSVRRQHLRAFCRPGYYAPRD